MSLVSPEKCGLPGLQFQSLNAIDNDGTAVCHTWGTFPGDRKDNVLNAFRGTRRARESGDLFYTNAAAAEMEIKEMKGFNSTRKWLIVSVLWLAGVFGSVPATFAEEIEPNHPCDSAQVIGAVELPFALEGSLDSNEDNADVDFYRFIGPPGALVKVDLEGVATAQGTLGGCPGIAIVARASVIDVDFSII